MGLKVRHHHQLDSARHSAMATAQAYAVDLTTYDHAHLDADFKQGVDQLHRDLPGAVHRGQPAVS